MITCIDGYEMAKQGRAGPALGISALGSYIAGTLGLVGLMFFARPIAATMLGLAILLFIIPLIWKLGAKVRKTVGTIRST